jgi:hypothetical protein
VKRLLAALALLVALALGAAPAAASDTIVAVGHDEDVSGAVERVVVVAGNVRLHSDARVAGDVIVLFGNLDRDPGSRVGGSEYVVDRGVVSWVPGPSWVEALIVIALVLIYRALVWAAVWALAAAVVRTATYERLAAGWTARPLIALVLGAVLTVVLVPALALLAATGLGLPLALVGLAGLLVAAGFGLALLREGPLWPRRPGKLLYAAYLIVPPALEIGLLLTCSAGLGATVRAAVARARGASA